jgi:hypothetical protein
MFLASFLEGDSMLTLDNLIWYRIPGYNGYEYNFENEVVRSIKNYKVNPIGKLIKKYTDNNGNYYYMSNMQNERCKVYISDIINLINSAPNKIAVNTYSTNLSPRNIVTRNKYLHADKHDPNNKTYFPTFDNLLIDDTDTTERK